MWYDVLFKFIVEGDGTVAIPFFVCNKKRGKVYVDLIKIFFGNT